MANVPNTDLLTAALLGTGLVNEVWHCSESEGVTTLMCRAAGKDREDKFRSMSRLAGQLLRLVGSRVLVAQQFIIKDGKLGYSWNISVFGDEAALKISKTLQALEALPPAESRGVPEQEEDRSPRIKVLRDTGPRERGGTKIMSFPLPHVRGSDRNRPTKAENSPLGYGKGAQIVKAVR